MNWRGRAGWSCAGVEEGDGGVELHCGGDTLNQKKRNDDSDKLKCAKGMVKLHRIG